MSMEMELHPQTCVIFQEVPSPLNTTSKLTMEFYEVKEVLVDGQTLPSTLGRDYLFKFINEFIAFTTNLLPPTIWVPLNKTTYKGP